MIRFDKIIIKGYKSYQTETTFEFANSGMWFFHGENGVGKTNLIEALGWCLTGKTFKGLLVDQVINWTQPKNGVSVILYFSVVSSSDDSASQYRITRARKGRRPTLEIAQKRSKQFRKIGTEDPQAVIDELIGLTWEELLASVIYHAEDFQSFIESGAEERQRFLEHIFQLDRFDDAQKIAIDKRREAKRVRDDVKIGLLSVQSTLTDAEGRVEVQKNKHDEYEHNRSNRLSEINNVLQQLHRLSADHENVRSAWKKKEESEAKIEEAQKSLSAAIANKHETEKKRNEAIVEKNSQISDLQNECHEALQKKQNAQSSYQMQRQALESALTLKKSEKDHCETNVRNAFDVFKRAKQNYQKINSEDATCPQCGQTLPMHQQSDLLQNAGHEMMEAEERMKTLAHSLRTAASESDQAQATLDALLMQQPDVDVFDAQIQAVNEKISTLYEQVKNIKKEYGSKIEGINESIDDLYRIINEIQNSIVTPSITLEELEQTADKIKHQETLHESVSAETNPFAESHKAAVEFVEHQRTIVREHEQKSVKAEHDLEVASFLADVFKSKIKASVIQSIIPVLNFHVSTILNSLLPDFEISFDEHMSVKIIKDGSIEIENPKSLSTGQRASVNFTVCLAVYHTLRQVRGMAFNVTFFDELLDIGLDSQRQQIAFELLRGMGQAVYIVSHRDESDFVDFDGSVKVEMKNGTTTLETF